MGNPTDANQQGLISNQQGVNFSNGLCSNGTLLFSCHFIPNQNIIQLWASLSGLRTLESLVYNRLSAKKRKRKKTLKHAFHDLG